MKYVYALLLVVVLVGCAEADRQVVDPITNIGSQLGASDWLDVELVNIQDSSTYRINTYREPVIVSFFQDNCITCQDQHQELALMNETAFVLIYTQEAESAQEVLQQVPNIQAPVSVANNQLLEKLQRSRFSGVNHLVIVCPDRSHESLPQNNFSASQLEVMASDCR